MSGMGDMSGDWVLLRGLAREAGHWGGFVELLQRRVAPARVAAIDLPGAGGARGVPVPLQVDGLLQHVRGEVARLGLRTPLNLLGLSLGGMVAAHWVPSAPRELARVVLVNSSLRPLGRLHERLRPAAWWPLLAAWAGHDGAVAERRILALTSASRGLDRAAVLEHWLRLREQRPVARADALRQLAAAASFRLALQPPESTPLQPHLLVLASRGDRLVNPVCSERLAAAWGCPLAMHPWAGHDLPLDDPAWVLDRVLNGLRPPA